MFSTQTLLRFSKFQSSLLTLDAIWILSEVMYNTNEHSEQIQLHQTKVI